SIFSFFNFIAGLLKDFSEHQSRLCLVVNNQDSKHKRLSQVLNCLSRSTSIQAACPIAGRNPLSRTPPRPTGLLRITSQGEISSLPPQKHNGTPRLHNPT